MEKIPKKFMQTLRLNKKILSEGNFIFKVKCQGIVIKKTVSVAITANFLHNALK